MEQIIGEWTYEFTGDDIQEWLEMLREYYQTLEVETSVKQPLLQVVQAVIAQATTQ